YLTDRLGRANTRRRKLLKYHEIHHEKIAGRYPDSPTVAPTLKTQTAVSIIIQRETPTFDAYSETDQSQTSYASTVSGGENILSVHPPPDLESAYDGIPFLCPYCHQIIQVTGRRSWMRHVFRDLRPCVCTFKGCPKSDYLFASRHDWFEHEIEHHRRRWYCSACDDGFSLPSDFQNHLQMQHSLTGSFNDDQVQTVIDRCERPQESNNCVLSVERCNLRSVLGVT
ncbi:hypothetical protein K440DRAFT_683349, partial [Wilcoxina mikolae CBS 423.85]